MSEGTSLHKATFAAGCFWGVEAAFKRLPGVVETRVGYTGGRMDEPSYGDVCAGSTGHFEACEILFDPQEASYEELLELFWSIHDPSQPDGQGNDIGTQYMSAIFYHNPGQMEAAQRSMAALEASGKCRGPLSTRIMEAGVFWDAEEYHQKYLDNNPGGYCHINMAKAALVIDAIVKRRRT